MFIFSLFELNVSYFVFWLLLVFVVGVVMFEDNKKKCKNLVVFKKIFFSIIVLENLCNK